MSGQPEHPTRTAPKPTNVGSAPRTKEVSRPADRTPPSVADPPGSCRLGNPTRSASRPAVAPPGSRWRPWPPHGQRESYVARPHTVKSSGHDTHHVAIRHRPTAIAASRRAKRPRQTSIWARSGERWTRTRAVGRIQPGSPSSADGDAASYGRLPGLTAPCDTAARPLPVAKIPTAAGADDAGGVAAARPVGPVNPGHRPALPITAQAMDAYSR